MQKKIVSTIKYITGQRYENQDKQGFTLIEALVAIAIVMLAVTGPLMLSRDSLSGSMSSQGGVTAQYLAEDAVEYIKGLRNYNMNEENREWLDGLEDDCVDQLCKVDTNKDISSAISPCDGECEPLRFDEEGGQYGYDDSWEQAGYTREVTIVDLEGEHEEVELRVEVNWNHQGRDITHTAKRHMFDLGE